METNVNEVETVIKDMGKKPMNKLSKLIKKILSQKQLQLMALLGLAWMLVFNYAPMVGLQIAFKDYNIIKPMSEAPWVGLKHFKAFLEDENFWSSVKNTLGLSIYSLVITFPLPIIFALFLNEIKSVKYKKFVQTVSYLPHFLSWVILGGMLTNWLSDVGIINKIFIALNIIKEPIYFLGEPQYFWGLAIISNIWKELGWSAIIYLAAISSIDPEMYEAATVDGAGRFRKMWSITLPSIRPTISMLFILAVAGVLNSNFDQIFVLRNSLNQPTSEVIDIFVYRMGLQMGRHSYATAIGMFKSVIAFILLFTANKINNKISGSSIL
ncbi:ABC transporter permease [Clostridium thermarum]|uniref:ABC transporter permease n=1 Tax=Clostridium thermarum TaxID=1716543 RepID=UPI001FAD2360|nr:ABC transporter permease subunit [Clostridium thermarum]